MIRELAIIVRKHRNLTSANIRDTLLPPVRINSVYRGIPVYGIWYMGPINSVVNQKLSGKL